MTTLHDASPARQPHTAVRLTRQASRDYIAHAKPHRPDLLSDPDVVDLVKGAWTQAVLREQTAELPTFIRRTRVTWPEPLPIAPLTKQCPYDEPLRCDGCGHLSACHRSYRHVGGRGQQLYVRCCDENSCLARQEAKR